MVNIGVICPSEIAFRRFMPAMQNLNNDFHYVGIAVASKKEWGGDKEPSDEVIKTEYEKAEKFKKEYGGKIFSSYEELICSSEVDAIYLPLPPALHYFWGKKVLEAGKHLFMEKPFTTSYNDSCELIELARRKGLIVHENYMFAYHSQINYVKEKIKSGELGTIRLIRVDFGFPFRGANDFRYNKSLGGGALIDCGGYTIKLVTELLGETVKLESAFSCIDEKYGVDVSGGAALSNADGMNAQVSFGMDNTYRCSLDIWGSKKSLYTNRILTAPVGYSPVFIESDENGQHEINLDSDDTFGKSLSNFYNKITNHHSNAESIILQAKLIDDFYRKRNK